MTTIKKTAIITGGGSGLGLAIAKAFTQNNINTVIVGRDEEKLKIAKAELGENYRYYEQIKGITQMMRTPQMRMPYDIVIR